MKHHKIFWGSSYDRGLDLLLGMWPKIIEKFPDATLEICYGWNLFETGYANNPERMAWKENVDETMKGKGITHHGRIGQDKLREVRSQCGIWAYPTWFAEINCITALESQRDGLVPVVMAVAALKETVGSGVKVEGDIYLPEAKERYLNALLDMMGDEEKWKLESEKAKQFAQSYAWEAMATEWAKNFD